MTTIADREDRFYWNYDKSLIYKTTGATCVTVYIRHALLRSVLVWWLLTCGKCCEWRAPAS
jgi:hypothetical protein